MKRVIPSLAISALAAALSLPALAVVLPSAGPTRPAPSGEAPVIRLDTSKLDMAPRCIRACMTAVEAVTFASYVAPKAAIAGEFAFSVQAVGEQDGRIYLNSEKDYRDRNNLTIVVPRKFGEKLAGASDLNGMQKALIGHRIVARGLARRVQINFIGDDGQRTDKYYYQIHVPVSDPRDVALEGVRSAL